MEKVTIRLAKSLIGRGKEQIAVAHSLGLNRPGEVTEQPDNAATQGKIAKIAHLVVVTKLRTEQQFCHGNCSIHRNLSP